MTTAAGEDVAFGPGDPGPRVVPSAIPAGAGDAGGRAQAAGFVKKLRSFAALLEHFVDRTFDDHGGVFVHGRAHLGLELGLVDDARQVPGRVAGGLGALLVPAAGVLQQPQQHRPVATAGAGGSAAGR